MSYMKNANYEYICLAGSIYNADADGLNDITGTVITAADGTGYYLDDFIETADGLTVCVIITAASGGSCYDIIPAADLIAAAADAAKIILPALTF